MLLIVACVLSMIVFPIAARRMHSEDFQQMEQRSVGTPYPNRLYLCQEPSGGASRADIYDEMIGQGGDVSYTFLEPSLDGEHSAFSVAEWTEDTWDTTPVHPVPKIELFTSAFQGSWGWPVPIPPVDQIIAEDSYVEKMCATLGMRAPCFDLIVDCWCPDLPDVRVSIAALAKVGLTSNGLFHTMPFTTEWIAEYRTSKGGA